MIKTEVYTDANPEMAIIAIEKTETKDSERRFELIVVENKCKLFFEVDAIRIALSYLPDNQNVLLHCDKAGDVYAIQKGKTKNLEFQTIIDQIKKIETKKNLTVEYNFIPRKQNYAGRMLDKVS